MQSYPAAYGGVTEWLGNIDNVFYWNRALTQTEITELYTKENAGTTYPW